MELAEPSAAMTSPLSLQPRVPPQGRFIYGGVARPARASAQNRSSGCGSTGAGLRSSGIRRAHRVENRCSSSSTPRSKQSGPASEVDDHQLGQGTPWDHRNREQHRRSRPLSAGRHLGHGIRVGRRVELHPVSRRARGRCHVQHHPQADHADQRVRRRDRQAQQHQLGAVGGCSAPGRRRRRCRPRPERSTARTDSACGHVSGQRPDDRAGASDGAERHADDQRAVAVPSTRTPPPGSGI